MRYLWIGLCLAAGLACRPAPPAQTGPQRQADGTYHWTLAGQHLAVDPAWGGRPYALRAGDTELLTPRSVDSLAFGASFWPSPQRGWPRMWPPPAALDAGAYRDSLAGEVLWLIGPVDSLSGWQMVKTVQARPADTAWAFGLCLINRTDSLRQVAPWEIVRLPKGGMAFFPIDTGFAFRDFAILRSRRVEGHYQLVVPPDYQGKAAKISAARREGWVAYARGSWLLWVAAADLSPAQFAPQAGEVELYIDDYSDYIEIEQQGAYEALGPGDSLWYQTRWYARPIGPDTATWAAFPHP